MKAKKVRDIWVAHHEGKTIQWKCVINGWVDEPSDPDHFARRAGDNVNTNPHFYRIKPEPVVFWVNAVLPKDDADQLVCHYDTQEGAEQDCIGYDIIARRVELDVLGEEE